MKIALIVLLFPPRWVAGTEIATYNIAKYLSKKGHEVHVITSLDEGLALEDFQEGFYIHRIKIKRIRFIGPLYFWYSIFRVIKKTNVDIIHIQHIGIGVPGLLSKFILKKPYVLWGQGSDIYRPDVPQKLILKMLLKNASSVIALTNDMKKKMNKIFERDIIVIPNGVNLEKFKKSLVKEIENNFKTTVLFVGTLRPVKGVRYLIEAMKIVKQRSSDTQLIIVGDGENRKELEELTEELGLKNSVYFAGKVNNEEIPKYMESADVFVLPSLSESFGIVNIEAMAAGLPIVSTNVGGLPEIIKNGVNGFTVDPKNPNAIADKIILLLENYDLRIAISINNKKEATKYSWEIQVEELVNLYQNIISY